jgi:uncharacterized membrane protein
VSTTVSGIFIGAVLALSWIVFGFWAFLFVAVAMALGALVARVLDGKLDLGRVVDAFRSKRSSS